MKLPEGYKDANDMLRQNKHKEFVEAGGVQKLTHLAESLMYQKLEKTFLIENRKKVFLILGKV